MNGTRIYGGPESRKCKESLDGQLKTLFIDLPETLEPTPPKPKTINFYALIRQLMYFPSQLTVMINSCAIGSSLEAYGMALRYFQGYTNIWDVLDIFAFNFGLIYDSIINTILDLVAKAADPTSATSDKYLMLGYGLGNIFYLIFYAA